MFAPPLHRRRPSLPPRPSPAWMRDASGFRVQRLRLRRRGRWTADLLGRLRIRRNPHLRRLLRLVRRLERRP